MLSINWWNLIEQRRAHVSESLWNWVPSLCLSFNCVSLLLSLRLEWQDRQALVRLQLSNMKISLIIFWAILMFIFVLMLMLLVYNSESSVQLGGAISVYIYSYIVGIVILNETLPFSVGMNIRRKDYYSSSMIVFVILSLMMSTIITLFSKIETWFSEQITIDLAFFPSPFIYAISEFRTDTAASEWVSHFVIVLFVLNAGYLIAAVNNRFGKLGMFTLSAIILLFIMIMSVFQLWGSLEGPLSTIDSLSKLLLLIVLITVFFSGISYALLKRSVVRT